jgi:hypothetical protein
MQAQSISTADTLEGQEIVDLVNGVDDNCLAWTAAWYPAFVDNQSVTELLPSEVVRFNTLRFSIIDQALDELSDLLPANKKTKIKRKK